MQSMQRGFLISILLLTTVVVTGKPLSDIFVYKDASGLYFRCNSDTKQAVLIPTQEKNAKKYRMEHIGVPTTVTVEEGNISTGGTSQSEQVYTVTEVDDNALKGATAYSITFAEPSSIVTLGERALYDVWASGTLTLPSSLRLMKREALYVVVGKNAADYISKLVLPASLDSLCVSAVVLDRLQELVFEGTVPPRCEVLRDGLGAYNPWTAEDAATSPDVMVTYPESAFDAYKKRFGIGDYFTCFKKDDPETPTGVEVIEDAVVKRSSPASEDSVVRKVMQNGRVVIIRSNRTYNLFGQGM